MELVSSTVYEKVRINGAFRAFTWIYGHLTSRIRAQWHMKEYYQR